MNKINRIIDSALYPSHPYWTACVYGFGKWIRRYGYYPPILPLCINTDHAPGEPAGADTFPESKSSAPFQFFHSPRRTALWKKRYFKPAATLYSPFVFARQQLRLNILPDAKGTIFFIAHTTEFLSDNKDIETYISEITSIPEKYKPITICLHHHDIKKGLAKKYSSYGFKVVSAGDPVSSNFTQNFYKILQKHKYCMSNLLGSYALYATEMNIPFGLYGTPPKYINHGDKNIPLGTHSTFTSEDYYAKGEHIFRGLPEMQPTDEQLSFAKFYLGMLHGSSRLHTCMILYFSLSAWLLFLPAITLKTIITYLKSK